LSAKRRVEDSEASLAKAEKDYNLNLQQASEAVQAEIKKAQTSLEAAQTKAEDDLPDAARRIEDAETSLSKASSDFNKSSQQLADTATQNSISAVSLELDIAKQQSLVDELSELMENGGVVYTDLEGVVSSAMSEGSITAQNPLISFMDGTRGFEAQLQIGRSDAEKLAVGDECEVTTGGGSLYYRPTVTGTISGISTPDESDKVTVMIRLPDGDWTGGQRVDVQAVQSRDTYDLCVPISALRSDNTGYYLFTVEQKSTVLGVENVVRRTPVTVTASDDSNAAISGPVGRDSQIITASNKAVEAGDRVRMNE